METGKKIEARAKMGATPRADTVAPKPEADVHIMLQAELEFTVRDKHGNITRHEVRKAESFLRAFIELLYVSANGLWDFNAQVIRDTGDVERYIRAHTNNWYANYEASEDWGGILVGRGTTDPNISDFRMEDLIVHGGLADQLGYSDMAVGFPGINVNISQITLTRSFANSSGANITVNEIGCAVRANDRDNNNREILILRDIISGGIAVPDGDTLTINYRLQAEA